MPSGGSVAQATQRLLGSEVRVVSAFHNVAATKLKLDEVIDCDVLVCGDDSGARRAVISIIEAIGIRAIEAGPIANSLAVEALTAVLIYINKRYKISGAGVRITGIAVQPARH